MLVGAGGLCDVPTHNRAAVSTRRVGELSEGREPGAYFDRPEWPDSLPRREQSIRRANVGRVPAIDGRTRVPCGSCGVRALEPHALELRLMHRRFGIHGGALGTGLWMTAGARARSQSAVADGPMGSVRDSESDLYFVVLGLAAGEAFELPSCRRAERPVISEPSSLTRTCFFLPFWSVISAT